MTQPSKQIVAGPWVGEFGWELMSWQAHLRLLSKFGHTVSVICNPRHRHLYEDFAVEFDDFITEGGVYDCWKWYDGSNVEEYSRVVVKYDFTAMRPSRYYTKTEQLFIRYGNAGTRDGIVLHCRGSYGRHPERGWPIVKWQEFVRLLTRKHPGVPITCIGRSGSSHCIDGCVDYRDVDLKDLCNTLAASRVVVGASSGPLCLASLCHTPHVVWGGTRKWSASGNATIREKFESSWNPLRTPVTVLDAHEWDPPAELVLEAVSEYL